MKTRIKMRMLGATVAIMAMLVGSAKAQLYNSTFEIASYYIAEEVIDGDSVVVLEFYIEDVISITPDRTYTLYTADGSFALDVKYAEPFNTRELPMQFKLDNESYNEFLIKGVGKLELDEYDAHLFSEEMQGWITTFLALKSTGLREGESFADYD
jgi:hypothetical protein